MLGKEAGGGELVEAVPVGEAYERGDDERQEGEKQESQDARQQEWRGREQPVAAQTASAVLHEAASFRFV